ncbi:AbiTii domain-containing protein [Halpernia frigidisoli]|uniref:AbiTii domain-containing protein n=1 Tax=Halpernia frigidisoli TaxID=1125876 RepID=A0A1I3DL52_9FLAO|nr:hypothetical protein [Halpernia frigidisoli]SFH87460.1 hypothetical protein SAMN05443292_0554 [Halpernia frigidisoli]
MDISKNFILEETISDLINVNLSLTGPLIKLNYFGKLIKNSDLIEFTNKEINGYESIDKIPKYRKSSQRLFANVQSYMNNQNVEVPISMLEEPFNKGLRDLIIFDGIQTIEKMAKEMLEGDGKNEIFRPIPMEMLSIIQKVVNQILVDNRKVLIQSAHTVSNAHIFLEIQSSIRVKLLDFVMEIGEKFGHNIEISSFKENIESNNQIINNIMNTTITSTGDGNVLNTGNDNNINMSNSIIKNDLESLKKQLKNHGIEENDVIELGEIVSEENLDENNNLGENSRQWILKILDKSLQGIGKISTAVSAQLLSTMIKTYYGIGQ